MLLLSILICSSFESSTSLPLCQFVAPSFTNSFDCGPAPKALFCPRPADICRNSKMRKLNEKKALAQASFTLLRSCYDLVLMNRSFPFTLFLLCKERRKKHPFPLAHIDPRDYRYGANDILLYAFTCSGLVKLIVKYWSIFKNLRFSGNFVWINENT